MPARYTLHSMASLAAPQIERYRASLTDPDQATAETVAIMCRHIHNSALDPLFRKCARQAIWRFGGGASGGCPVAPNKVLRFDARDPRICSFADFWWAKHYIKFVHHEDMLLKWLNEADQLQLLISPDALIRMVKPQGDCAIYTMAICALLECQGIPWEIVTVAVSRDRPNEFSHVFPRAILPSGARITLDAGRSGSANMYPGWQVPMNHRYRTQVWDSNAQPVDDAPQWSGLHDYRYRGQWGRRWGIGDDTSGTVDTIVDPTTGNVYSSSTGQLIELGATNGVPSAFGPSPSPVTPSPSSTPLSPAEVSALSSLAQTGLNLVGRVVAPTTTITGPGGTSITTPANAASANILAAAGGLSPPSYQGGSSTWLLIGRRPPLGASRFQGRQVMYVVNGRARGLGLTAAQTVATVGSIATPIGQAIGGPVVGAAISAVTTLVTALVQGSGCGVTCVETSQWANQAATLLNQNLSAYLAQPCPRSQSSQQAAETNFNNLWAALQQNCSQPGTGNAGVRCISDRQRGGKFDWFAGYYDPIANDTCVVSDAAFQAAAASTADITTSASGVPIATSAVAASLSGIPTWAWLAAAALGIWAVAS